MNIVGRKGETEERRSRVSKHGASRPQKPQGLLGTGRRGEGDMELGGRGILYTYRFVP